jgi:hypothetical protein
VENGKAMKANNGSGNTSERDGWRTNQILFDALDRQYHFRFDCCATAENTKCAKYSSNFENTNKVINGAAWMNPPFSIARQMFVKFFKVVRSGVAIYRCENLETAIWQEIIFPGAYWVFIPNRRVSYEGMAGSGARFPSALVGVRVDAPMNLSGYLLLPEAVRQ